MSIELRVFPVNCRRSTNVLSKGNENIWPIKYIPIGQYCGENVDVWACVGCLEEDCAGRKSPADFGDICNNQRKVVDISLKRDWPANVLSNFYEAPFYFDGVYCASKEGLLQALKTQYRNEQIRICSLSGIEAKKAGQKYNDWKDGQFLWWNGYYYYRKSKEYWDLLKRIFDVQYFTLDLIVAILATGDKKFIHSVGESDKSKTVLTEEEFCKLMTVARQKLKNMGLVYKF